MFAPFTRSMTFTLGLFSLALSPDSLADTDPDTAPAKALELGATTISADSLGATTEHTGAYTTGSMSTATRLNLSVKETPQSISVITRQQMEGQSVFEINQNFFKWRLLDPMPSFEEIESDCE